MSPFYSIQNLLDDFSSYMPDALIPIGSLQPFRSMLTQWPAEIIAGFTFEARLGENQPQVDFSFNVEWPQRRHLATVAQQFINSPLWERLYSLILSWNIPEHPLYDHLNRIWFEFDGNAEPIDAPGLCFNAIKHNRLQQTTSVWKKNPDLFLDRILPLLTIQSLDNAVRREVYCCIDQLPPEVEIIYVCAMLSRATYCPRLLLGGFSPDTLLAYLSRIHWSGNWRGLKDLLDRYVPSVDAICLDISEAVLPTIGIESRGIPSALKERERWRSILQPLVKDGLCVPNKAEAMLSWLGASEGQLPFHQTTMYMWRIIDHLKFMVQPDGTLQAKVYLSWHAVEKPSPH